jgi:hypothetical protein
MAPDGELGFAAEEMEKTLLGSNVAARPSGEIPSRAEVDFIKWPGTATIRPGVWIGG